MSFHYEVVTEPSLAALFRQKFLENVGKTRCCEMFRLVAAGMPNLWQFKVNKDVFTLSFNEEPGERKERLVIESMTLDLSDVILAAVQNGLVEYLMNFLEPLAKVSRDELDKRIKSRLGELQHLLLPEPVSDVKPT